MSDVAVDSGNILCEHHNHIAIFTLERPEAHNALSLSMLARLHALLESSAQDRQIRAVLLRGAGTKAFCAGGDLRLLYESLTSGDRLHHQFFIAEYALVYLMAAYPKPYVALMDGIVMGGGMGLAQGSRLRIVGERTRMAMPETGIGLFPDAGASFFLARCPGTVGRYLALTGAELNAADALYAGLADVFLAPPAIAALADELRTLRWTEEPQVNLGQLLLACATKVEQSAPLAALATTINRHFSRETVPGILESLAQEHGEHAAWAERTATLMRGRSPTMMAVALRQLQRSVGFDLASCLRMELGMVERCFEQGDIIEGIRALIIDKDRLPRWKPFRSSEVTDADVAGFFRDRWPSGAHPLRHLGFVS